LLRIASKEAVAVYALGVQIYNGGVGLLLRRVLTTAKRVEESEPTVIRRRLEALEEVASVYLFRRLLQIELRRSLLGGQFLHELAADGRHLGTLHHLSPTADELAGSNGHATSDLLEFHVQIRRGLW